MEIWLLFFLLSLITYYIIERTNKGTTQTPIWLLWLVIMTPAFIWSSWTFLFGQDQQLPPILFILPLLICPLVYSWLVNLGRPKTESSAKSSSSPAEVSKHTEEFKEKKTELRPISNTEETALRNCFPWGIYYLQNIDYKPQAILCRGKLRSTGEIAYKTIKKNVEKVFGDRFIVLFQESFKGQPFFALVPNPWSKSQPQEETEPLTRPVFALSLLLITLFTTTLAGTTFANISSDQVQNNPSLLLQGLPYSLGLIFILAIHELSHYLTAIYYKIKTTLPYFIPIPLFIGTFGAYVQMRSPVPHRKALFDVAIAGPIGGIIATIPLLIWGLSLSEVVPINEQSGLLNFNSLDPRFSFLFAVVSKFVLGDKLISGMAIHLHPLAIAGYLGLMITALNLIPVGQLDGGHIVHGMFGQRIAMGIGQITRLLMFILALIQPAFLIWAIVLLLMPVIDQPALNDVTELDNLRDFLGLICLGLLIIIVLPLPGAIAQWLAL